MSVYVQNNIVSIDANIKCAYDTIITKYLQKHESCANASDGVAVHERLKAVKFFSG